MTTARPILFSAPMIRALLDGSKTQTRRIVNPQPPAPPDHDNVVHESVVEAPYLDAYCSNPRTPENPRGKGIHWCWWTRDHRPGAQFKSPYGAPGDLLWVRETWAVPHQYDGHKPSYIPISARVHFEADGKLGGLLKRPSLFMPRWASRLTLELTDVRIERLQDISEQDAIAEGCGPVIADDLKGHPLAKHIGPAPVNHYAALWERINGETGPRSWNANPWVWALTFRVHQQNIDAYLNSRSEAA